METQKPLMIAVVNDIHQNMHLVERMEKYWKINNIKVDYLIVCGDFANMNVHNQDNPDIVASSIDDCKKIIKELEKLCPTVLYVPGNHDPTTLFHNSMHHSVQLTENSINLHRCAYHLKDNLVVVGCGGSVPQYDKHICHKVGYPYETDEQYKVHLNEIMPEDGSVPTTKITDSLIIVTHNGPSCSHTALKFSHNKSVMQTGSTALSKLIENPAYKRRLTCVLHGHTHDSQGLVNHELIPIINAGALKRNQNFVVLTLREIKGNWKVTDTNFHCFGYI
ncbi:hypothetical protein, conserved [Entamoeba dispar SAW760]|uniref:Calcineurin-like phosphoesterase domain-containing protein n=1 Tax=Entamoeba dispar (strain ATCC PRA-260 / SAW760) TaxID=370354 RepID=B0ETB2_ENTDS|nr:uncharacterized protein EDI_202870 [Entamoeba dispar SAW760]EDR22272.1 hypothetical protein, conserved [Entamoeba dispar SAW760]|eukprot:EDR22272.1 hypothetical protein, conserved [Entamoeba dispar SAW760]